MSDAATMIPNEAKNHFLEIARDEMFEMDRSLAASLGATTARMASRGLGVSGVLLGELRQEATNSLKSRGQCLLGQLLRCLAAHHVGLAHEVVADASRLLRDTVEAQAQIVRDRLFGSPVFRMQGMAAARQSIQNEYDQEGPRLIRRLVTELEIAAAASQLATTTAGTATSLTFNGPVALVQTGDGTAASVNQHVDAGVKCEIAAALQGLIEQLDKSENAAIGKRAELRELAIEAKAEAEKVDGNVLKLGSSLRTIAETTKFIGSLGPAYQVLKPLLNFFGIHLP